MPLDPLENGEKAPWSEPAWVCRLKSPYYNDSHRRLRSYIRQFVQTNIEESMFEWAEKGEVPRDVVLKWFHSGIPFSDVPVGYRPSSIPNPAGIPVDQLDIFHHIILADETSRVNGGVMGAMGSGSVIGVPPVVNYGTEAQKEKWLPGLFSGDISFCLGITEIGAGSDVGGIETKATKSVDGKSYIVNGSKKWITSGLWATHCTAAVRTGEAGMKGISLLVIPLKSKGVVVQKIYNSGQNAGGASFIEFDDVVVPAGNLIGKENEGFRIIMNNFNRERFVMAVACNRMARTCLSEAFNYSFRRHTFGKPLIGNQAIRHKFATLARYIESHWAWIEHVGYHLQNSDDKWQNKEVAGEIALLKIHGGRLLELANREAQHVLGGIGYQRGNHVELISRDLRMMTVGGGSEEILNDLAVRQEILQAQKNGWKL